MVLMDVPLQYAGTKTIASRDPAHHHFDGVAPAAPSDILGLSAADTVRACSTPPFGKMVGRMQRKSDPQIEAFYRLLGAIGPGVLSALGGGFIGKKSTSAPTICLQLASQQAAKVTAMQVQEVATKAEQQIPGVLDKIGGFYSNRPQLVKTLGSAAFTIALAGVARPIRT